eukprot:m.94627 g.94627  ORF g.94627 m.94627 type:complete len:76 (-) comp13454_c0_seq2:841-1068(-)
MPRFSSTFFASNRDLHVLELMRKCISKTAQLLSVALCMKQGRPDEYPLESVPQFNNSQITNQLAWLRPKHHSWHP